MLEFELVEFEFASLKTQKKRERKKRKEQTFFPSPSLPSPPRGPTSFCSPPLPAAQQQPSRGPSLRATDRWAPPVSALFNLPSAPPSLSILAQPRWGPHTEAGATCLACINAAADPAPFSHPRTLAAIARTPSAASLPARAPPPRSRSAPPTRLLRQGHPEEPGKATR